MSEQTETATTKQAAELAAYRALELGALDGRVSAACGNPEHPTWLRKPDDERSCPWCRIAELETYAHGCDTEGCVIPHSSWCQRAIAYATEHHGCTCGRPWEDTPQPHAGHCWLVNPPRSEVDTMRARIAALETELAAAKERHKAGLHRADEHLRAMNEELQRYAKGTEAPVLWSVYNKMHSRAATAEARVAELERKYVGAEPTIAEEMAYLSRCIDTVLDLCEKAEEQAGRWEQPLPVPEWVAPVRAAAEGLVERTSYPPALPWAALMDDEDLQEFLSDLIDALHSNPTRTRDVLDEIEKTCGSWRAIAEAQHAHNTAPGPNAQEGEGQ
ncbi:hypothetical protein ACFCYB_00335 [Streptomyces sp. NPDC056309]|uniref:hypothetical protein n=1 Tax=Streptomyces sp. NPDC056309 TaxID=3345781 RepID=UPI0035E1AA4A